MIRFCLTLLSILTVAVASFELKADATSIDSEADGKWIINHPDSKRVYAVQCGLDVTLFALKYFKIDYSLPLVSLGLPLSSEGISLADVQQMLQVYGLEASARKGATIKQIAARLDGEYIAVIPLSMGGGRNHYYLGMMDNQGIVGLVNVSRGVSPLVRSDSPEYNERLEKRFAEAGGIVLFIRKPVKEVPESSLFIKCIPEQIELGEFMIDGSEAAKDFSVSFELFNTSDRSILVSSVQASCGCTVPEWEGGIIKPKTKQTVGFTVIPGAWGRGERQKMARVTFADGSNLDATIHGTGQTPVERQRIELSQYSTVIEITDDTPRPISDVRLARLTSYARPVSEIAIKSNVPWLTAGLREPEKAEEGESEHAELYAKILTEDLSTLLVNGEQRQRCVLDISGAEGMEPVTMSLELFERDFYRLSQYYITAVPSQSEPIKIAVTPDTADNPISILDVSSDAPFLDVETDGKTKIRMSFKADAKIVPGYYFVTAKIENTKLRRSLAKITVYVPSEDK